MYIYHVYAWCPWRPGKDIGFLGTGVEDGCEQPCVCWALTAEPSLQLHLNCSTDYSITVYNEVDGLKCMLLMNLCVNVPIFTLPMSKREDPRRLREPSRVTMTWSQSNTSLSGLNFM